MGTILKTNYHLRVYKLVAEVANKKTIKNYDEWRFLLHDTKKNKRKKKEKT